MHFSNACAIISERSRDASKNPGVAKFGIALEWGSRGRWFESSHSDQENRKRFTLSVFFLRHELLPQTDRIVTVIVKKAKITLALLHMLCYNTGALAGNSDSYLGKNGKGGMDKILAKYTKWIALVWVVLTLVLSLI